MIAAIVDELAPNLVARNSIGHIGAAQLLPYGRRRNPEKIAVGGQLRVVITGVSPAFRRRRERPSAIGSIEAETAANSALHIIAIGRLRTDQRTRDYVTRRIAEGHSKLDAIRALKRYLAREVFTLITQRRKGDQRYADRRLTNRRASAAASIRVSSSSG